MSAGEISLMRRHWMRFAGALLIVGLAVTAGRWLPILGLDRGMMTEVIAMCSGRGPTMLWPYPMVTCPGPSPVHIEMGGQALLGSAALMAAVVVWFRRRWPRLSFKY